MPEHTCGSETTKAEDEALFSGLIDGVLTQADEQRVRLRLEGCAACQLMVDELRAIRENAKSTEFVAPDEEEWDERPRSVTSSVLRSVGWILVVSWLLLNLVWLFRLDPMSPGYQRILLAISLAGWAALLVSVLLDRLKRRPTDPYRRIVR